MVWHHLGLEMNMSKLKMSGGINPDLSGGRAPLRRRVTKMIVHCVKLALKPGLPPGSFLWGCSYLCSSSSDLDQLGLTWNGMEVRAACPKGAHAMPVDRPESAKKHV